MARPLTNKRWTSSDTEKLRTLAGTMPGPEIAEKLKRTLVSVWQKAKRLEISLCLPGNRKPWSAKDDGILQRNAGKMGLDEIAGLLERKASDVRSHATRDGISLAYYKMRGKPWSAKELKRLRVHGATHTAVQLTALLPGRTALAIRNKAIRQNIAIVARAWWTPKDEKFLRRQAGTLTGPQIAARLERTYEAVVSKAKELGLSLAKRERPLLLTSQASP